ncbi:replication initiator protein A [Gemmiger sp.]
MPLPRFLLQDEALRDISNDAKVLYALLLDRASIFRQNGYVEPDGTIRLYFKTKLHRSRQSATRIFRELEYSGLIIRKKQGLGKPALITLNYPADAKLITKEAEDAQA